MQLSAFPALLPAEFHAVCRAFYERFRRARGDGGWDGEGENDGWCVSLRRGGGGDSGGAGEDEDEYLTITRPLAPDTTATAAADATDDNDEDDDKEALIRHPYAAYDVLLSRTYQVPVLWVSLHCTGGAAALETDLERIYARLVPAALRSGVEAVGVLGGVGVANHPLTDVPTFFVHPCNTAEAMREVAKGKGKGEQQPGVEEYLLLWLGLVGGAVGLWVPADVAAAG